MATKTAPTLIKKALASGMNAARAKGPSPKVIEIMPIMIASIDTIVTERGRCVNDSLSVLYQVFLISIDIIWSGELIWYTAKIVSTLSHCYRPDSY
jgi:hypothetical protein